MNNRTFDITFRVDLPDAFMVDNCSDDCTDITLTDTNGKHHTITQAVFIRNNDNDTYTVLDKHGDDANAYICTVSTMETVHAYIKAYHSMDIMVPAHPLKKDGSVNTEANGPIFEDFNTEYDRPTPITITEI